MDPYGNYKVYIILVEKCVKIFGLRFHGLHVVRNRGFVEYEFGKFQ